MATTPTLLTPSATVSVTFSVDANNNITNFADSKGSVGFYQANNAFLVLTINRTDLDAFLQKKSTAVFDGKTTITFTKVPVTTK
jgi:hypothetical protein